MSGKVDIFTGRKMMKLKYDKKMYLQFYREFYRVLQKKSKIHRESAEKTSENTDIYRKYTFFSVELISRRDIKNACTRADDTFADLRLMATLLELL